MPRTVIEQVPISCRKLRSAFDCAQVARSVEYVQAGTTALVDAKVSLQARSCSWQ